MQRRRFHLVEESLWELLETLGAHEALLVVKFPVAVYDLLQRGEAALAALAHGVSQSVGHVAEGKKRSENSYGLIIRLTTSVYFKEKEYLQQNAFSSAVLFIK